MIQYIAIGMIGTAFWIAYEIYTAPMMDEQTGKIIKEGKKLSDLFKKNSKNKQLWMSELPTLSQRA